MELNKIQCELLKTQKVEKEGDDTVFVCSKYQQIQIMTEEGHFIIWANKVSIYKELIAMYVNNYLITTIGVTEVADIQIKEFGGK